MRSAPGVCCVLLAIVVVGLMPAAQADSRAAGTGPLYSVETLRSFELFGIHLGMTREEAHKALAATGLTLRIRYPEDPEQDVIGESFDVPGGDGSGALWTFGVDYTRGPGRVPTVSGFGYYRTFPRGEGPDAQQRRADAVKRFGPPSHWKQRSDSMGEMLYSLAYVPLSSLIDEQTRDEATTCMIQWECLEGRERADCRKKMKRARVPIVEIVLLPQSEDYSIADYEAMYAELARAPGFHGRRAQAICPVPSVH